MESKYCAWPFHRFVYRLLANNEKPTENLKARDPAAKVTVYGHVRGRAMKSQFISTSASLDKCKLHLKKAKSYNNISMKNNQPTLRTHPCKYIIVKIDLASTSEANIIDLTDETTLNKYIPPSKYTCGRGWTHNVRKWAKDVQEILIVGCEIPAECMKVVYSEPSVLYCLQCRDINEMCSEPSELCFLECPASNIVFSEPCMVYDSECPAANKVNPGPIVLSYQDIPAMDVIRPVPGAFCDYVHRDMNVANSEPRMMYHPECPAANKVNPGPIVLSYQDIPAMDVIRPVPGEFCDYVRRDINVANSEPRVMNYPECPARNLWNSRNNVWLYQNTPAMYVISSARGVVYDYVPPDKNEVEYYNQERRDNGFLSIAVTPLYVGGLYLSMPDKNCKDFNNLCFLSLENLKWSNLYRVDTYDIIEIQLCKVPDPATFRVIDMTEPDIFTSIMNEPTTSFRITEQARYQVHLRGSIENQYLKIYNE